jgi:hypothetical protein
MRTSVFAGSLLSGLVLLASPLKAQLVSADIAVRSGPVVAHVAVADGYSTYRPRRVVYYREAPHVLVVERVHYHRHAKHWKRHGFRPVTVYVVNGRYYDRWDGPARGLRRVVVYERGGRYYEACDREHHRHDWDD